jgi:lycopene cyclase domain-containing protein
VTGWEYLGALVLSLVCAVLMDYRWKLFFWVDARRAAVVLGAGIVLFLLWDISGILSGVFFRGDSPGMTGLEIAPDFPPEELLFITFLCYMTMVLFGLARRVVGASAERVRS